jgi:hypothetical protein
MVTYCISSDCVALLLPPEVSVSVRSVVSFCLRARGFSPWPDMEAELFCCPKGRLLIARPCPPRRMRQTSGTRLSRR